MEENFLAASNYFVIFVGFFFFLYGVVIIFKGKVMSDPAERFEGKIIVGLRARLMGIALAILGVAVVGFGFVAI